MKFLGTIFLITIISQQTFAPFIMFGVYYVNQKTIIEKYCINKNTPSKHCNGKCYLNRKIKQYEQGETQKNESNNVGSNINIKLDTFIFNNYTEKEKLTDIIDNTFSSFQKPIYHSPFLAGIFHPPSTIG